MKPGGGKAKGASMERAVCKALSLWLTQGQYEDALWRSSMSGGRATVALRKGKQHKAVGDVCALRPEGVPFCDRFYVEIKHLKKAHMEALVFDGDGPLDRLWTEVLERAAQHGRMPILILKQNLRRVLLFSTHPGMILLQGQGHSWLAMPRLSLYAEPLENVLSRKPPPFILPPALKERPKLVRARA